MDASIRIAQLLCSRLCHDLAGPAGAVNAGVEFLNDGGGEASEAAGLALQAAHQMSRRLEFYRAAVPRSTTPSSLRRGFSPKAEPCWTGRTAPARKSLSPPHLRSRSSCST